MRPLTLSGQAAASQQPHTDTSGVPTDVPLKVDVPRADPGEISVPEAGAVEIEAPKLVPEACEVEDITPPCSQFPAGEDGPTAPGGDSQGSQDMEIDN